jgi:hypothetical protein
MPAAGYVLEPRPTNPFEDEDENETLDKKMSRPIRVRMNSYRRRVWVRLPKKTDPTAAPIRRKPKP